MNQQGRSDSGKFASKSDEIRQVRSIRLTDTTWNKFGELAEQRRITRADLLENWMNDEYYQSQLEIQDLRNNSFILSDETLSILDKLANQRSITREELIISLVNSVAIDSNPDVNLQPLNNTNLAKRLGIDPSNLSKQRAKGNEKLAAYTAAKDPDCIAWRYSEEDKLYYPLK